LSDPSVDNSAQEGSGANNNNPPNTGDSQPENAEPKGVTFSWGIIMVRTKKLLNFLDDLAKYRIFSDLGWLYIGITIAAGAFMIWLMLDDVYKVLDSSLAFRCAIGAATASQCHTQGYTYTSGPSITSYLLLPGVNPYIPVLYGIVGIVVAIVVHEGTHGVIARRLKLPVKSTGLLFFLIVPIGAFVEIDEKLIQKIRARDSGRIMAGGPGSNVIVGAVALLLLVVLLGGLVPHQFNGVYVFQIVSSSNSQSPADQLQTAGHLHAGDLITAVNGTQIRTESNLTNYMSNTKPNQTMIVTIDHNNQLTNYTIKLTANPDNSSIGFIGIGVVSSQELSSINSCYTTAYKNDPFLYLVVPGIVPQFNQIFYVGNNELCGVPFSSTFSPLYTSPIFGALWAPVALTLFWIFFININLAFFNAIPLYPLDGGQAILNWFSHFGRKWVENRAKLLTTICSVAMLALILTFILLPRILSVLPY
jgi:membrane-associated protease RseP (regulator of RpoE activity)